MEWGVLKIYVYDKNLISYIHEWLFRLDVKLEVVSIHGDDDAACIRAWHNTEKKVSQYKILPKSF